jgi:hypothetical protein
MLFLLRAERVRMPVNERHIRRIRFPAALGTVCMGVALLDAGCRSHDSHAVHANAALSTIPLTPEIPVDQQLFFPGLSPPAENRDVQAVVVPPAGWRADPLKASEKHNHQVWISPSGNTAYGVIRFKLPLPVGPETVLRYGFLPEMRRTEGEARLLSSKRDPDLPGLRFIADGGKYRLRTNLLTRGWTGWAVYAGTLRAQEIVPDELALAEIARDNTVAGLKR